MNKFTQVLRGSAGDVLIAGASYFVFNSLFFGEPVQLLEKRFGVFCFTRFKDEFGCRVLYLIIIHNSYIVQLDWLKALHNSKQEWTSESIHETCIQ